MVTGRRRIERTKEPLEELGETDLRIVVLLHAFNAFN
jgi:hypothetical protein